MKHHIQRTVLIGIIMLMATPLSMVAAQEPTDACQFLQGQVASLEARAAILVVDVTEAQAALDAAAAPLPIAYDAIRQQILAGERPVMSHEQNQAYGAALLAEFSLGQVIADLLNVLTQIQAFEDAAFFICEQGDSSAETGAAAGDDNAVQESSEGGDDNAVQESSEGGDEIIIAEGDPFILEDLIPDDGTTGWEMLLTLSGTTTDHRNDNVSAGVDHSFRFRVGDNGTLYTMAAYDSWLGVGCEVAGSIALNGDQFTVTFNGTYGGGPGYRDGQLVVGFSRTPDENGHYPLLFEQGEWRTFQLNSETGQLDHIQTGVPLTQKEGARSYMERITLPQNYIDGDEYCGDGVP